MGVNFDVTNLGKAALLDPEQMGYKDSLEIIKDESYKVQKSFVKIGWYLKHIRDNELYREDGYANVYECAADQLGYSQSTVSRFINICEKFSKEHNSPELDAKYAGFDKSQMIEMLPMEPEQLEKVTSNMSVREIREVKNEVALKLNEPDDGEIRDFCRRNIKNIATSDKNNLKEYMINRYGKKYSYAGGPNFEVQCSPRGISINNSGEITWARFVKRVKELEELIPGSCFGLKTVDEETDDNLPGQTSIEDDFPEYMPETVTVERKIVDSGAVEEDATSHRSDETNMQDRDPIESEDDNSAKDIIIDGTYQEIQEEKSAYRLVRTEYPEGSLLSTEGCDHKYDCFLCAQDCGIRQKERYCVEAPLENPYPCTTMNYLDKMNEESGNMCQFINNDLAEHTSGSNEADPCCKKCDQYDCIFRCERAAKPEVQTQTELPLLKNNDQRKEWLKNYKVWGLWYRDENIDVNYYKFDFDDGSCLVVTEYPERHSYYSSEMKDEHFYHLLEKNKKGYGKDYDEKYRHQTDSETYLVEFLKNLQKRQV